MAEVKDFEGNIIGYEHTYKVTADVPAAWNITNQYACLITWEKNTLGCRAFEALVDGTCTIKYFSKNRDLSDAHIALQGQAKEYDLFICPYFAYIKL